MKMTNDANLAGRSLALQAERVDADAWFDQWQAAPDPVRQALGLAAGRRGELRMVRSRVPFSHFNMVLTLGCPEPVDASAFAAIESFYGDGGASPHWIVVNDHSEPADLATQLLGRGYADAGAWDRVILQGAVPDRWAAHANGCELVSRHTADEWSRFVVGCYGMPPVIGDWLLALVDRPGWIHALRRDGGRPVTPIAMVRSLFHDGQGWAWLGIDAPVPGVMAPCYDADQHLVARLMVEAARRGVRCFVSDIEQPGPARDTEAYQRWGALGFEAVYRRRLFSRSTPLTPGRAAP